MYLRNRSLPSGSVVSALGKEGSFDVVMLHTDESIDRNAPPAVRRLKISAKNRGLGVFFDSQQGMRNATGWLPGTLASRSTQRSNVDCAFAKSPPCRRGHG